MLNPVEVFYVTKTVVSHLPPLLNVKFFKKSYGFFQMI